MTKKIKLYNDYVLFIKSMLVFPISMKGEKMGKTTTANAPSYPIYSKGSFSINGTPIATSTYSNGVTASNVNLTPAQKKSYTYAQEKFAEYLPNVNTFLPETIKNMNLQTEAFKNFGIKSINEVYSPMIKNLQNDIASRFGSLNNSIFMDNLGKIEDKRADSVNLLAQDVALYQNQLADSELQKQYNYLNFLNNYQNQLISNMLGLVNSTQSNLSSSNAYQNQLYNSTNNNAYSLPNQLSNILVNRYLKNLF